jgi:predicted peptidase
VVFLHGSGYRGNDPTIILSQDIFNRKLPAIVVAPQCLPSLSWNPEVVADLIRYIASQYPVDRKQIYLTGHSMGGYGTWETAKAYPDLFAALVPLSAGGNPEDAPSFANVAVWAFHGAKDKTIPVAECERMIDAIREAGGRPKLTIIPGAGHAICKTVCQRSDLWKWLFQQRRQTNISW